MIETQATSWVTDRRPARETEHALPHCTAAPLLSQGISVHQCCTVVTCHSKAGARRIHVSLYARIRAQVCRHLPHLPLKISWYTRWSKPCSILCTQRQATQHTFLSKEGGGVEQDEQLLASTKRKKLPVCYSETLTSLTVHHEMSQEGWQGSSVGKDTCHQT